MAKAKGVAKYVPEATGLGASKYSPVFAQIAANEASNKTAYDTGTSQRLTGVNAELGSIEAAGATTQKLLTGLGTDTASVYQQALAKSQSDAATRQAQTNQNNSNLMSSLQSEMKARGLSGPTAGQAKVGSNAAFSNNIMAAIQSMQEGALTRQGLNAQDSLKGMQGSSRFLQTTDTSNARGVAQKSLDNLYAAYLEKKMELEGQKTVTEKEKSDYIYQTAYTLKDRAEQKAAQKAAAGLANAHWTANFNQENEQFAVKTQIAYDKMTQAQKQKDIENNLKQLGFNAKVSLDAAKLAISQGQLNLGIDKLNWDKVKPTAGGGGADAAAVAKAIAALSGG